MSKIRNGVGRIEYEDDIVRVYRPNGSLEFVGTWDDCTYKNDDMTYDKTTRQYKVVNPEDSSDYRIIIKQ